MCGIVGYVGQKDAGSQLLRGLSRLEYRGYDSAGVAVIESRKSLILRSKGRVAGLERALAEARIHATVGIAHTRWATHGVPAVHNAHPHHCLGVSVVHNGIVENHEEIKARIQSRGPRLRSETDTEVIAHLYGEARAASMDIPSALRRTMGAIEGRSAFVVLDERDPRKLAFARMGSPLVLGLAQDGTYVSSDAQALAGCVDRIVELQDGDYGFVEEGTVTVYEHSGRRAERAPRVANESFREEDTEGFDTYMRKEIQEQPRTLRKTLEAASSSGRGVRVQGLDPELLHGVRKVVFAACGSSNHAALFGRQVIERLAGISADAELASEFRYRNPVLDESTLVVGISQSGETADTLAALELAQSKGARVAAIVNVRGSAIAKLAGERATLGLEAGPEIGVASTKAFTSQLAAVHLLALALATETSATSAQELHTELDMLKALPELVEKALESEQKIQSVALELQHAHSIPYLGRGPLYPLALEGALKSAELAYIHAQGFAAGEMKHGPIALVEKGMPIIVLAGPEGEEMTSKSRSNMEEVVARGAHVIAVTSDVGFGRRARAVIPVPQVSSQFLPIVMAIPLQLLSYHLARTRGLDVDKPRNLAKSVTVE